MFEGAKMAVQEAKAQQLEAQPDRNARRKERAGSLFSKAKNTISSATARVRQMASAALNTAEVTARVAPTAVSAYGGEAVRAGAHAVDQGARAVGRAGLMVGETAVGLGVMGAKAAYEGGRAVVETSVKTAEAVYETGARAVAAAREGIHSAYEWSADQVDHAMTWVRERPEAIKESAQRGWDRLCAGFKDRVRDPLVNTVIEAGQEIRRELRGVHDGVLNAGASGLEWGAGQMLDLAGRARRRAGSAAQLENAFVRVMVNDEATVAMPGGENLATE